MESLFFTLANAVQTIVWSANKDGIIDFCNPYAQIFAGRSLCGVSIYDWAGITPPGQERANTVLVEKALRKGQNFSLIALLRSANGVDHEFLIQGGSIRNRRGELTRWTGTATFTHRLVALNSVSPGEEKKYIVGRSPLQSDSSDLNSADFEAERLNRRFEFLAEAGVELNSSLEMGVVLQKLTELALPRLCDFMAVQKPLADGSLQTIAFGHRDISKFYLGRLVDNKKPPPETPKFGSFAVLRTGQSQLIQNVERLGCGELGQTSEVCKNLFMMGPVRSLIIVPLKVRNKIIATLNINSSVSQRVFDENDVKFAEEFAQRLALAIDNSELYAQSQKINSVKDEFLATLSHELRTPMNVILGHSELLRAQWQDSEKNELLPSLEAIHRNALAQIGMIEDMLDTSSLILEKACVALSRVALHDLINDAIDNIRLSAEGKGLRLKVDLSEAPKYLYADLQRMHQVLWNLLNNAIKYTPLHGSIDVKVTMIPDSHVRIEVRDSGIGIEPEFLPYVFDRFSQEDVGSTRRFGGLGLGLAIVQNLVQLHSGSVEVQSEGRNQGTTFIVNLPLEPGDAVVPSPVRVAVAGEPVKKQLNKAAHLSGLKILLVEDDSDTRMLTKRFLELAGAEIVEAASAPEAFDHFVKARPDLIVSDIGMAGEDGISLIGRIRRHEQASSSQTPAAALTAYTRAEERTRALRAGFQLHIAKPFTQSSLISALQDLRRFCQ